MKRILLMGLFATLMSLFSGCDKRDARAPVNDVQYANADDFLFSMATICDELPISDNFAKIPADALQIHEDYWRQVEFISSSSLPQAEKTLKEFLTFRDNHRKGLGFTEVYIRNNIYPSLESLGIIRQEIVVSSRSLVIDSALVVGGFAVTDTSGAYLYGQAIPDGTVKYLGIEPPSDREMSPNFITLIVELAQNHGLVVVDWYKGALVEKISSDTLTRWAEMYKRVEQDDQEERQ